MARALQRIDTRTSEHRPECLQQPRLREQFILHVLGQRIELAVKGLMKADIPAHDFNMLCNTYDVNRILR